MTDLEYRWSLGNTGFKTVVVKPKPEECLEKGMSYTGEERKRLAAFK